MSWRQWQDPLGPGIRPGPVLAETWDRILSKETRISSASALFNSVSNMIGGVAVDVVSYWS